MVKIPEKIETVVTSTRLRLARNLSAYPFPSMIKAKDAEDVLILVRNALGQLDKFREYDIWKLDEEERMLLQEQHLISPALREKKDYSAAFISTDNQVSVMVNEEDHLREQYIVKDLDLVGAYEKISGIDDLIGSKVNFAYDKRLGYLTACPSNLGTGMRASVMMFLPGLTRSGALKELLPTFKKYGLTVRGVFGEGSKAEGYTYQISNERTLGLTESELLGQMTRATMTVCDLEIRAREEMVKRSGVLLLDRCLRAYGTLTHCALLTYKEFLEKMSDVRLGMALDFFEVCDIIS